MTFVNDPNAVPPGAPGAPIPTAPPARPVVTAVVPLASRPATTQLTLREMIGEVQQWNAEASSLLVTRWLNNAYRKIIDERSWCGLRVRGQVQVPDLYSEGAINLTNGDPIVVGTGTHFTPEMVGRQLRVGMTEPLAHIASVEDETHLTLDMPWGGYDHPGVSFRIYLAIVSLGANTKRVEQMVNLRQGWKFRGVNVPQEFLNAIDPRRNRVQQPYLLAEFPVSSDGQPMWELYPHPLVKQAFPFTAWTQPPDMVEDDDYPHPFIRTDILVSMAISEALVFGGPKENKYFNPVESANKKRDALYELEKMRKSDDNLAMQSLRWNYEEAPDIYGSGAGSAQDREW